MHHIDEDKGNHEVSNLICLCNHCHGNLHRESQVARKSTSTYRRKYGYTLKEMGDIIGCTGTWVHTLITSGRELQLIELMREAGVSDEEHERLKLALAR